MTGRRSGSYGRLASIKSVAWRSFTESLGQRSTRYLLGPEIRNSSREGASTIVFRSLKYGLKRLAKVERELEEKRKREARRYNKAYPGELVHFDSKRLPLIKGEDQTLPREYLFVAIDDFSRELYAGIFPDKTQCSSELFLRQVADECPYTIEYTYSDNGKEFKGASEHAFVKACSELGIGQKFTRINRPQTNGKAERVIRTIMEMWHQQETFQSRKNRQISLLRFINFYNTVKPHKGIDNMTPYEKLLEHFYGEKV